MITNVDKAAIKADPRWQGLLQALSSTHDTLCEDGKADIDDVLDADRLTTLGGPTGFISDNWVSELIHKFGYEEVSKFLMTFLN
jgi:hypothetical protein